MTDDRRLIEDYLPIQAISKEASREKNIRKGHICTLHLWWARRPLVACRAAVYGALVPADQWVQDVPIENGPQDPEKLKAWKEGTIRGLNRRQAKEFVTALCKYPGDPRIIEQAQKHILTAHAKRLTAELEEGRASRKMPAWVDEFKFKGDNVTMDDIVADRAPRPRVLDMFAGGGAIPLEALRLGCEAHAMDLNPVAHIIELCTLVYPQKYGRSDPTARGMTGPAGKDGKPTWGGLADEVRYWGNWVLEKVRAEISDLYPLIPDPAYKGRKKVKAHSTLFKTPAKKEDVPPGYLIPVAYLWTRTVKCKNPACGATVPLVKQTWLCKKEPNKKTPGRCVALRMVAPEGKKQVHFEVVEKTTEKELGFNPAGLSKAGNATCPFCGTVADSDYVKAEGCAKRMGQQMMAVVGIRDGRSGKVYRSSSDVPELLPDNQDIAARINLLSRESGLTVPTEQIVDDAKNSFWVRLYGVSTFGDLFFPRQQLCLLSFVRSTREAYWEMQNVGVHAPRATAVTTHLAAIVDRLADFNSANCTWNYTGGRGVIHSLPRQAIPISWDSAETNPFNPEAASWVSGLADVPCAFHDPASVGRPGQVMRASATSIPIPDSSLDAVITDPPYYDNVSYADISDFFYVWLKRTVGELHPEHFAGDGTPKKNEAVADASRHGGDKEKGRQAYEQMMDAAFCEANRSLKPSGQMTVVYAHKTTLGWSTLVDALRRAGFTVTEAWPLNTERGGRLLAMGSAALASSIFLVARKREVGAGPGSHEDQVRPELTQIVRERVETLWEMEIAGADLVIACVGAGLRAFTRYERVEFANGEEVPAERFLTEVETVVLETILAKLSREVGTDGGRYNLAGVDPATRFYVLWRYTYRLAELDAGEAIIFANGTHVELEGTGGLCYGNRALLEKKKSKYRLRDYTERGKDEKLGQPGDDGEPAPLVDALHRTLWLMDSRPGELGRFLAEANVNLEQMRLVAQALAGPTLKGSGLADVSPAGELGALARLTANWRSLTEGAGMGPLYDARKE